VCVCVFVKILMLGLHCCCRINSRHKLSTLSDSPEPLKCCVLKPHHTLSLSSVSVFLSVLYSLPTRKIMRPLATVQTPYTFWSCTTLFNEKPPLHPPPGPSASYLSCRHLHFAYAMHCQLQDPQYGLLQLVCALEISFWEPRVFLRFVESYF